MQAISSARRAPGEIAAAPSEHDAAARPRAASGPCEYQLITSRAAFDTLAAEWTDLFARCGRGTQLFQTFAWNWHWCNHYLGAPGRHGPALTLITARRAGRLVMVWPLVTTRILGLKQLGSMGEPVSQYSDALVETVPDADSMVRDAWAYVVDAVKPDFVWLPHVREDAAIAPLMSELQAGLQALPTRRLEAPFVDVATTPDFDTYMRRHSAHARKKYRAAGRRLAAAGDVHLVEHGGNARASALASHTIEMKQRQLVERGLISPAFADARMRQFFADAAGAEHPTGTSVYAIECDGECIAANIVVSGKGCMLGHVFTFDSRFAKDSIGVQLLHHMIERAIDRGHSTLDLLAPADDYKMREADATVSVVDWAVPISARGEAWARLYLQRARPLLKAGLQSLPHGLRRALASRYYRRAG